MLEAELMASTQPGMIKKAIAAAPGVPLRRVPLSGTVMMGWSVVGWYRVRGVGLSRKQKNFFGAIFL